MTVREKTALLLLAMAAAALVAAGAGFGALWGAGWPTAAATAGVLALAGGLALAVGDDEAPEPRTWVTVLHEWATDPEVEVLDFEELPVPERLQLLLEQLRAG